MIAMVLAMSAVDQPLEGAGARAERTPSFLALGFRDQVMALEVTTLKTVAEHEALRRVGEARWRFESAP